MLQNPGADSERKILAILQVLSESSESLGSITIARRLIPLGYSLSERAIRYHLRIADERGYTRPLGRDGRMITTKGREELRLAMAPDKLSFILEKLETLAFRTTFNPKKRSGLVPINVSLFDKEQYPRALESMQKAFRSRIRISEYVATAAEGEKLGDIVIPAGKVGLATVCSVIINGVLLKNGVPIDSKFGGVLEVRDSEPRRFIAIINYGGTSLDPSEQYIRARMTTVLDSVSSGNGRILANFRELPSVSRELVSDIMGQLNEAGFDGMYRLGDIGETVCQISVGNNRVGLVLLGGLNPVAAVVESGIDVENIAESGMMEFKQLIRFRDL